MNKLHLTQNKSCLVDKNMYDLLSTYKWYYHSAGYAARKVWINGEAKTTYLHHYIMGYPVDGKQVDHINQNKLDNRRINLRFVSRSINLLNQNRITPTYFKNKTRIKRWRACIKINKVSIGLKYFKTKLEAIAAIQKAKNKILKEFK